MKDVYQFSFYVSILRCQTQFIAISSTGFRAIMEALTKLSLLILRQLIQHEEYSIEMEAIMKRTTKLGMVAALAVTMALTTACAQDQANPNTGAQNVPSHTTPEPSEPANQHNDTEAQDELTAQLQYETATKVLAPGESYRPVLKIDADDVERIQEAVQYTSSDEALVTIDPTGHITVADDAEIGSVITVTAKYEEVTAELAIEIKYSLDQTVDAVTASNGVPVVTNPDHMAVIVNKQRSLPDGFEPKQLSQPDVSFSFSGESEKKLLQEPAARALEELFAKADEEGIVIHAVSGYRSFGTQSVIFNYNVKHQGYEEARRYSAMPGTSEHQTGLAMDVSSPSVGNALDDSLGDTEEGKWLAANCAEFGFIIRYPEGKEEITGYAYEPWHLRYVGPTLAKMLTDNNLTLEEYFAESIPVSQIK